MYDAIMGTFNVLQLRCDIISLVDQHRITKIIKYFRYWMIIQITLSEKVLAHHLRCSFPVSNEKIIRVFIISLSNIEKIVNRSKRASNSKWNFPSSTDSGRSKKYFQIILHNVLWKIREHLQLLEYSSVLFYTTSLNNHT